MIDPNTGYDILQKSNPSPNIMLQFNNLCINAAGHEIVYEEIMYFEVEFSQYIEIGKN